MDASRLVIHPDNLRFKPMSRAKRAHLRRQNIKALIRNTPAGQPISLVEFQRVTQSRDISGVYQLLKNMIKRGEIIKTPDTLHPRRHSYTLTDTVLFKNPAPRKDIVPTPEQVAESKIAEFAPILKKAKEFAWEQDSDSLREFIKWLAK